MKRDVYEHAEIVYMGANYFGLHSVLSYCHSRSSSREHRKILRGK